MVAFAPQAFSTADDDAKISIFSAVGIDYAKELQDIKPKCGSLAEAMLRVGMDGLKAVLDVSVVILLDW